MLFTDTGIVTYETKSEDVYEDLFKHKYLFDFTNFSKNSNFYDSPNKMVVDQTKIVYKEIPVNNFIGLKSNMCSLLSDDGKKSDTAKGVINITLVLMVFIRFLIFTKDLRKEILTDDHKQEKILIDKQ